jgi:SAM-dependent methyltransferase
LQKGWFSIKGVQQGDRTLGEQLEGLRPLLDEVKGKSVLDLGCAEGLITNAVIWRGAVRAVGLDNNTQFIEMTARTGLDPYVAQFELVDVNHCTDDMVERYASDIVLALAIFHKLKDPAAAVRAWARCAKSLLVVRLPIGSQGAFPSKYAPARVADLRTILPACGFRLERDEAGPRGERVHYWRRLDAWGG